MVVAAAPLDDVIHMGWHDSYWGLAIISLTMISEKQLDCLKTTYIARGVKFKIVFSEIIVGEITANSGLRIDSRKNMCLFTVHGPQNMSAYSAGHNFPVLYSTKTLVQQITAWLHAKRRSFWPVPCVRNALHMRAHVKLSSNPHIGHLRCGFIISSTSDIDSNIIYDVI